MNEKVLKVALMLRAVDNATGPLRGMMRATEDVDKAAARTQGLVEMTERVKNLGEHIALAGAAVTAFVGLSVHEFSKLEHATTLSSLPFMSAAGTDPAFAEVVERSAKIADATGTTRENVLAIAEHLRQTGVSTEAILGGGLDAAAKLAVVLRDLPGDQVGDIVASIQNGLGVSGQDLPRLIDMLQRVHFQAGLDLTEFASIAQISGPVMASLGVTGFEGTKGMLAFAASLYQAGLRGRALTPVLRGVLESLPTLGDRLKKNADVSDILRGAGISLKFFDRTGNFLGFENFIAQIEKLDRLSLEKRNAVLLEIGGPMGAAGLSKIATMGVGGFRSAQDALAKQASLGERSAAVMADLSKATDRVEHSTMELLATLGAPFARVLGVIANKLADVITWLSEFADRHRVITGVVMGAVAAVGVLLVVLGTTLVLLATFVGLMLTAGVTTATWAFALQMARLGLFGLTRIIPLLISGLESAIGVVMDLGLALLTTPVGWIIAGLAAVAAAVYYYWEPLSGFVTTTWDDIKHATSSFGDWLMSFSLVSQGVAIARSLAAGLKSIIPGWVLWLFEHNGAMPLFSHIAGFIRSSGAAEAVPAMASAADAAARSAGAVPAMASAADAAARSAGAVPAVASAAAAAGPAARSAEAQSRLASRVASPPGRPGGSVSLEYSPTIHLPPGTAPENRAAVQQALDEDRPRLEQFIEETMNRITSANARLALD